MSRTPILLALALALLVVIVLVTNRSDGTAPIDRAGGEAAATDSTPDPAHRAADVPNAEAAEVAGDATAAAPPRTAVEIADAHAATIRGRCVDEAGQPLSGVPVGLHGWGANSKRMDRYRLDHGDVEWTDPADVVTGSDGRFEHRFEPPPPYQFVCEAKDPSRVSVHGRWVEIAPGTTIDMGDVVLRPGVAVDGRLVDDSGVGLANRPVRLSRRDPGRPLGAQRTRDSGYARTDQRGFFTMTSPLPPGRYTVDLEGLVVKEPTVAVELAPPRADLLIVASVPPPDQRLTIEGVVVDARGQPVSGTTVIAGDDWFSGPRTGRDGAFVLKQSDDVVPTPVALGVVADGCVPWRSPEPVAWGTRDLRITLVDGPPFTVRVRRADDDSPVERFGVVLAPLRTNGGFSSSDDDLQHLGDHPGGVLQLPRASTGRFRFAVVPDESSGLVASADAEIEIEPGVPRQLDVRVAPRAERVVEVVTTRGEPVRGARVELLWHRRGGEITLRTMAMSIEMARVNSPDFIAVLVDEATTDADGRATLRGRSDGALALRLPGPGHVPALVVPFRMTDEGAARVVVGVGGEIVGRLEPASLLTSLRLEAGLPAAGDVDSRRQYHLPRIALFRDGPDGREAFPDGGLKKGLPLAADGSFEVGGIPPGTWDVHLQSFLATTLNGLSMSGSTRSRVAARGVTIAEGERRELVLDLASWRRWPVTIRARLDGELLRGSLSMRGTLATANGRTDDQDDRSLELDGEDELVTALPAGSWTTSVQVRVDDVYTPLPGPTFVVAADSAGPTHVDIDLRLGRCAVVVLAPDGQPARDVVLLAAGGAAMGSYGSKKTDAAGRTVLLGPVGPMRVRTRRLPLVPEQAFWAWMCEQPREAGAQERALIDLGVFDLVPGAVAEPRTIALPSEWAELPK